jgi:hypothetical protein
MTMPNSEHKVVTPPQGAVHKIVIAASDVPAFLAEIDAKAPEGKPAEGIAATVGTKGELTLVITYKP